MNEHPESRQGVGAADMCPESQDKSVGDTNPGPPGSSRTLWVFFICAIAGSLFIHEIGHCAVAWLHGQAAVPTPMKEYVLSPIPQDLQNQVALGGVRGSVAALLAMLLWVYRNPSAIHSALLAGAMTAPGFYALRFILFGRGHDASEFQEAQAALGLSYAAHAPRNSDQELETTHEKENIDTTVHEYMCLVWLLPGHRSARIPVLWEAQVQGGHGGSICVGHTEGGRQNCTGINQDRRFGGKAARH